MPRPCLTAAWIFVLGLADSTFTGLPYAYFAPLGGSWKRKLVRSDSVLNNECIYLRDHVGFFLHTKRFGRLSCVG